MTNDKPNKYTTENGVITRYLDYGVSHKRTHTHQIQAASAIVSMIVRPSP